MESVHVHVVRESIGFGIQHPLQKTGSLSLAKGLKSSSEPVNSENRFAINIYFIV